jgi:hypothetical protein
MNRKMIRFAALFSVFCLAVLWFGGRQRPRLQIEVSLELRETFMSGGAMAGLILKHKRDHGEFPEIPKLESLAREICSSREVFPERLSRLKSG